MLQSTLKLCRLKVMRLDGFLWLTSKRPCVPAYLFDTGLLSGDLICCCRQ